MLAPRGRSACGPCLSLCHRSRCPHCLFGGELALVLALSELRPMAWYLPLAKLALEALLALAALAALAKLPALPALAPG